MTVSVSTRLSPLYVGNNVNKYFAFTFRVFKQEGEEGVSIRFKTNDGFTTIDKSLYSVILNADGLGGFVEFKAPPSPMDFFYVAGSTPTDQQLDITNYDNFYPEAIENALDKLTVILQEWSTLLTQETDARQLKDEEIEQFVKDYVDSVLQINNPGAISSILAELVKTKVGGYSYNQQQFNEFILNFVNTRYPDIDEFTEQAQLIIDNLTNNLQQQITDTINNAVGNINEGFVRWFSTTEQLLAFVPSFTPYYAKAMDTKKIWFYGKLQPTDPFDTWHDTGLSELDQAKEYFHQYIFISDVLINNVPYLYVIADKNGRVSSGLTTANVEMKNIGGKMKEVNPNYQEEINTCKKAVLDSASRLIEKTCEDGKKQILSQSFNTELSPVITKADLSTFDVVIYGSGASAMTAARTAKDNGLSVCLICPDYRVGGMMSSGVSVFDGPTQGKAAEVGGINKAFQGHTRRLVLEISTYYGSSLLPNSTTFEPRVAQKVCNDWCNRYVDLLILDQQIQDSFTGVSVDNGRIVGVWTKRGFIKGNCFIDASYTGDLLRFAGVSWTCNVEAASTAEPQAGAQVGISFKKTNLDLTTVGLTGEDAKEALRRAEYTVVPNLTDPAIPPAGAAIPNMTIGYGTRGIVTNAADRIPFTAYKLDSYDRRNHLVYLAILLTEDFTGLTNSNIVRKAIGSQGTVRSLDGESLFNTNNALFAQTTRLAKDYPTANWKRRRQIEKEIIEHYVNLCYFLATDTAVPAFIRTAMAEFGHSPREWIDSPYGVGIQFKVYDRQGIRMVNDNVVTQFDFSQHYSTGYFNDPIGIFAYFFDGKKRLCFAAPATPDDKNWTLIEESRITVGEDSPLYAMPMRMLLPRKTECTNLVVAWCSAQTELAFHSCRMEATGGMQGEAAAAVCVAKIKNQLRAVQDVAYTDVRQILLNQNVFLG